MARTTKAENDMQDELTQLVGKVGAGGARELERANALRDRMCQLLSATGGRNALENVIAIARSALEHDNKLWDANEHADAARPRSAPSQYEDETPIVIITKDDEGDYIARDLQRDGCMTHGETEASALQKLVEVRPDYDAMLPESEARSSPVEAQGWQLIETAPKDRKVAFWVVPLSAEETFTDTSGNPIVSKAKPYQHFGKHGTWSSLSKALLWHELPADPPALSSPGAADD